MIDGIQQFNALKAVQAALPSAAPGSEQTVMIFNSDGTPAAKYPASKLIADLALLGCAYGTCSTAATTSAKEVTISNFLLLKFCKVSVLFTSAVDVADATLNISSTGAKPIKILGNAIQPGVIKAQMIVQFQYDGTNWNVVGMMGLEQSQSPSDLLVDLGLPSGVKWATRNIDITQANGFAASPFQYECSFVSWGNTEMHNPSSTSAFDYDWGTSNDGPYANTPGAALTANMAPSMDAARANLGSPWRQPTTGEFAELFSNCIYIDANGAEVDTTQADKRVTVNGVLGLYLQSKINGNRIFFACSGNGYGTSWVSRGSGGYYWSSSLYSATDGRYLGFYSGGVHPQNGSNRFYGFAVRAVQ